MKYIFFDIDGTLHKEDIFFDFIQFSLKRRIVNTVVFLPLLILFGLCYVIQPRSKIPLNIILFFIFLGSKKKKIKQMIECFCHFFLSYYTPFYDVTNLLEKHLNNGNHVVIISGSPMEFLKIIYPHFFKNQNITIIASKTQYALFSFFLKERCIFLNKKKMLDAYFKMDMEFYEGYSDSSMDMPILIRCKSAFWVDEVGHVKKINNKIFDNSFD